MPSPPRPAHDQPDRRVGGGRARARRRRGRSTPCSTGRPRASGRGGRRRSTSGSPSSSAWCRGWSSVPTTSARELTRQMGRPVAHAPAEITRGFAERATWLAGRGRRGRWPTTDRSGPGGPAACGASSATTPWGGAGRGAVELPLPVLGQRRGARAAGRQRGRAQGSVADPLVAERWAEGLAAAGLPDGRVPVRPHRPRRRRPDGGRRPGRVRGVHGLGGRRSRRAAGRVGPVRGHRSRAGRQGSRLRAGRRPVEATAAELVDGVYFNAGQSCCAVERIYVHRHVFDAFVEAFVGRRPRRTSWATRSTRAPPSARWSGRGGRVRPRPGRRGRRRRRRR